MSNDVPNLRGGHGTTIIAIVVPLVSLLGMFGGLVWQAAKYPDRDEFNAMRNTATLNAQDTAILKVQFSGFTEEMRGWRREQQTNRIEDTRKERRGK